MKFQIRYISLAALFVAAGASAQANDPTKAYIDAGFAAMDANNDGKVVRAEFDVFMRARLARQADAFDAAFVKMDADSNGTLSRAEAAAGSKELVERFDLVDTNKDGALTKDELHAAVIAAQSEEIGVE